MRKLNTRERRWLIVLAIGVLALWFGMNGSRPGSGLYGSDARGRLADPGKAPVVHLELLGAKTAAFDAQSRNLFAYYTPQGTDRLSRIVRSPVPPSPPAPPTDTKVTTSIAPREPVLPKPAFDYIGLLGPKDDLIAVFSREAGVFVAQVGDVIDDTFELLDFRYEGVVLGLVAKEYSGGTVTLGKSSS